MGGGGFHALGRARQVALSCLALVADLVCVSWQNVPATMAAKLLAPSETAGAGNSYMSNVFGMKQDSIAAPLPLKLQVDSQLEDPQALAAVVRGARLRSAQPVEMQQYRKVQRMVNAMKVCLVLSLSVCTHCVSLCLSTHSVSLFLCLTCEGCILV